MAGSVSGKAGRCCCWRHVRRFPPFPRSDLLLLLAVLFLMFLRACEERERERVSFESLPGIGHHITLAVPSSRSSSLSAPQPRSSNSTLVLPCLHGHTHTQNRYREEREGRERSCVCLLCAPCPSAALVPASGASLAPFHPNSLSGYPSHHAELLASRAIARSCNDGGAGGVTGWGNRLQRERHTAHQKKGTVTGRGNGTARQKGEERERER